MLSDLVVFDAQLAQISQTCNFYLCLFGYAIAFFYAFVYTTSKLKQLRIEHVDQLPAELADLRRGTDEVVTQLYDEVARVELRNQFTQKLVTAAIVRMRTLEAELDVLPGTQLHDEVARVHGANSEVHRELRRELIERHRRNGKIVAELREQVTRLSQQNDAASAKMRTLEAELNAQRQKHVELSDFARRAYIPPHAAVVAAAAKEERTRGKKID